MNAKNMTASRLSTSLSQLRLSPDLLAYSDKQELGLLGPYVITNHLLQVDKTVVSSVSDFVHSGKVFVTELDNFEVGGDPGRVRAFGEYDVSSLQTPGDQQLRDVVASPCRDLIQNGVFGEFLSGRGHLALRT